MLPILTNVWHMQHMNFELDEWKTLQTRLRTGATSVVGPSARPQWCMRAQLVTIQSVQWTFKSSQILFWMVSSDMVNFTKPQNSQKLEGGWLHRIVWYMQCEVRKKKERILFMQQSAEKPLKLEKSKSYYCFYMLVALIAFWQYQSPSWCKLMFFYFQFIELPCNVRVRRDLMHSHWCYVHKWCRYSPVCTHIGNHQLHPVKTKIIQYVLKRVY